MHKSKVWGVFFRLFLSGLIAGFYAGCSGTSPISSTSEVDSQVFTVSGLVFYANGTTQTGLEKAVVRTPNQGSVAESVTGADGLYSIQGLTAGEHKIVFSCSSYASVKDRLSTDKKINTFLFLPKRQNDSDVSALLRRNKRTQVRLHSPCLASAPY